MSNETKDLSGAGLWCTGPIPYHRWPLCIHGQERAHYVVTPNLEMPWERRPWWKFWAAKGESR